MFLDLSSAIKHTRVSIPYNLPIQFTTSSCSYFLNSSSIRRYAGAEQPKGPTNILQPPLFPVSRLPRRPCVTRYLGEISLQRRHSPRNRAEKARRLQAGLHCWRRRCTAGAVSGLYFCTKACMKRLPIIRSSVPASRHHIAPSGGTNRAADSFALHAALTACYAITSRPKTPKFSPCHK